MELGYERVAPGRWHGPVLDPRRNYRCLSADRGVPVRIELWDDEVDSIRTFDIESQRSIEELERVLVYPATEMVLTKQQITDGREAIEKRLRNTRKS